MGFRVGRSTDHDSTKRARGRDAARTARGTSAHAKPSADDFERSLSRVMPDVMCGTCAEAPAAVVRVESQTGVALCACARCDTRCARARCVADSNAAVARHPWVGPGLARAARRARARAWTRARRDRCAVNSLHRPRANPTRTAMRGDGRARIISAARRRWITAAHRALD